jgi:uracil-DNA glycosylase
LEKELIGHDKEIEDRIFQKYAELRVEKGLCRECNVPKEVNDGLPVSFFVVGENFQKQESRVMFVGKTVQSEWEDISPKNSTSGFWDARRYAKEELFLPFWSTGPFWQCIKEICQILWKINNPEEIWRRIAITNLVKCSTSRNLDETPHQLKRNCIQNAGFFEEEVEIVRPTHIVLFTGPDYDEYLKELTFGYNHSKDYPIDFSLEDKEITPFKGANKWLERDFLEAGKVKMRFLRTYHPAFYMEARDKEKFCMCIASWIKGESEK